MRPRVWALGLKAAAISAPARSTISPMKTGLRPKRSANPPRQRAPIRMPAKVAAVTKPLSALVIANSLSMRGRAIPPMKTINPSKNLPAVARLHTSHCKLESGGPFQSTADWVDAAGNTMMTGTGPVGRVSGPGLWWTGGRAREGQGGGARCICLPRQVRSLCFPPRGAGVGLWRGEAGQLLRARVCASMHLRMHARGCLLVTGAQWACLGGGRG